MAEERAAAVPAAPSRICRLEAEVVNRIAAGEVVVRPASALKELIENSLDAGSTSVSVSARSGGLKTLQIQDNGSGIALEDLDIVCERFTTSKLTKFEDLASMTTYGFRGEALASISHVAHLTITTKTAESPCAYKATYVDSKVVGSKPGDDAKPKPCAGVKGTTILVEDLFYNVPTRRNALKNPSDEYQRVLEVVTRYAIHSGGRGVAFTCKKFGAAAPDLHTQSKNSVLDNIQVAYGRSLARELVAVEFEDKAADGAVSRFKGTGYVSNANFSMKKATFILFINHRLVDCGSLRKAVNASFSEFLPKHTHPFVYLSVEMPPGDVDVNVHPTKREVHFLHEEDLVLAAQAAVATALEGANTSRTFYTQAILPPGMTGAQAGAPSDKLRNTQARVVALVADDDAKAKKKKGDKRKAPGASAKDDDAAMEPQLAPHRTIRTDARVNRLEQFLVPTGRAGDDAAAKPPSGTPSSEALPSKRRRRTRGASGPPLLDSVRTLLAGVEGGSHPMFVKILRGHTFVGVVDANMSLLQHDTKLYLVNHVSLCKEMFHQQALRLFSNHFPFDLVPPPSITQLAELGMEADPKYSALSPEERHDKALGVAALALQKAPMLLEYFSVGIVEGGDGDAVLAQLPRLVEGHTPHMAALPAFVLQMAFDVEWRVEIDCFDDVARALGEAFAVLPPLPEPEPEPASPAVDGGAGAGAGDPAATRSDNAKVDALEVAHSDPSSMMWRLTHTLFPAMRSCVTPSRTLADAGQIVQVACTEQLYKIFERC